MIAVYASQLQPSDSACSAPEALGKGESMFSFYPHGMSHKSTNALVALVVALVCGYSAELGAEQESKQAVTVVVICDDAFAQKTIRESLLTHETSRSSIRMGSAR
jgi:hypothetical protein